MSRWNERTRIEDVSSVLQRAMGDGLFDRGTQAAVFHDLGRVRARVVELEEHFPRGTLHAVAIKANPVVEILRALVQAGAGLEAASFEEVHLALAAGCPPSRIVYDSPAKTTADIEAALELSVNMNVDNFDELDRIASRTSKYNEFVGLRVNPQVGGGSIAITSVASRCSKFGVPLERREEIVRAFEKNPFLLNALHVHVGSQGMPLELLVEGVRRVFVLREEIEQRVGAGRIQVFDIGGGLPVAYRANDPAISLADYVTALREALPDLFAGKMQLVTEFGRAIHATAGWAASRVEYIKSSGEERMAVIHLGADLLARRAYRPDEWHHDVSVLDAGGAPKVGPLEPCTIVGPLCFAGDVIARSVPLPRIDPGDLVIVHDVGAYTLGMWSRHCSRGLPLVLGYDGDELLVLKERETPEDVVAFWSRSRPRRRDGNIPIE